MDTQRIGSAFRAVRTRRRLRQVDVAGVADVSAATISRVERGHLDRLSLATLTRIGAALEVRLEIVARWRGGDLDRLQNARHSALHESVARTFQARSDWEARPEVSFSIYGERGIIDVLAWHPVRRTLLVIELKTELVDVNELMGTIDRKRRLGPSIARDLGWDAVATSTWVIVAESRTNRRRIAAHEAVLRAAFPADGVAIRRWLEAPDGPIAALSTWSAPRGSRDRAPTRRIRP